MHIKTTTRGAHANFYGFFCTFYASVSDMSGFSLVLPCQQQVLQVVGAVYCIVQDHLLVVIARPGTALKLPTMKQVAQQYAWR